MNEHPHPLIIAPGHVFLPPQSSAKSTVRQKAPPPFQSIVGNTDTYGLFQLGFTCYNRLHSDFLSDYVAKTVNQLSEVKKVKLMVYSKKPLPVIGTPTDLSA